MNQIIKLAQGEFESQLPKIAHLRVTAWESSPRAHFVNRTWFPDGWREPLDDTAHHFVLRDGNRIIAAARLNLLNHLADLPIDLASITLPLERPFAYWSRLVVHPDWRGERIAYAMDAVRFEASWKEGAAFILACAVQDRVTRLERKGFVALGEVCPIYGSNPPLRATETLIICQNKPS